MNINKASHKKLKNKKQKNPRQNSDTGCLKFLADMFLSLPLCPKPWYEITSTRTNTRTACQIQVNITVCIL